MATQITLVFTFGAMRGNKRSASVRVLRYLGGSNHSARRRSTLI